MRIVLLFLFLFQVSLFFSQKKERFNDPFYLTGEINQYQFITRNQVESYSKTYKNKSYSYLKMVKFNEWYFIESVTEKEKFKKNKSYDSLIKTQFFIYDTNTIMLKKIIQKKIHYYRSSSDLEIDTITFTYENNLLFSRSKYIFKRDFNSQKPVNQWDFVELEEIDSVTYDKENKVIAYTKIFGNLLDSIFEFHKNEVDSSKFIDEIIELNSNYNFRTFDDKNKTVKIRNVGDEHLYIYNNLGQLVLIVKQDTKRNLETDFQFRNHPSLNPQIDYFIYNNENYLLEKIILDDYYLWGVKMNDRINYDFVYKFR